MAWLSPQVERTAPASHGVMIFFNWPVCQVRLRQTERGKGENGESPKLRLGPRGRLESEKRYNGPAARSLLLSHQ